LRMRKQGDADPMHSVPGVTRQLACAMGAVAGSDSTSIAERAAEAALAGLIEKGQPIADLAVVFVSAAHAQAIGRIGEAIMRRLAPRAIIAMAGEGVISGRTELEATPAVSLLAASLPGVAISPFAAEEMPAGLRGQPEEHYDHHELDLAAVADAVGMSVGHRGTLIFADPLSGPIDPVLHAISRARVMCSPGGAGPASSHSSVSQSGDDPAGRRGPIFGALGSASGKLGGNTLLLNGRMYDRGYVGMSFSGAVRLDALVSQGCRMIGPNTVVTSAKGQIIRRLGGRPALEALHDLIEPMDDAKRQQAVQGLMIGRVIDEYKERFGPGDYLIRNVVGVVEKDGSLVVAEPVPVGTTVRFAVRDADAADADLAMLLDGQSLHGPPEGALLISCNARGSRLFKTMHHDAAAVQRAFAEPPAGEQLAKAGAPAGPAALVPLAGVFAAGEIGPVGDGVFVHGQSACVVTIRARPA
jgi:small ligand-binding sensory domain FIST